MNLEKLYSKQKISEETVKELKENPYPTYELFKLQNVLLQTCFTFW